MSWQLSIPSLLSLALHTITQLYKVVEPNGESSLATTQVLKNSNREGDGTGWLRRTTDSQEPNLRRRKNTWKQPLCIYWKQKENSKPQQWRNDEAQTGGTWARIKLKMFILYSLTGFSYFLDKRKIKVKVLCESKSRWGILTKLGQKMKTGLPYFYLFCLYLFSESCITSRCTPRMLLYFLLKKNS